MKMKGISREIALEHSDTLRRSAIPNRATLNYLLFLIFPASLCGCDFPELKGNAPVTPEYSAENECGTSVKTSISINGKAENLDIFTFDNDRMERLDSYQRFEKEDLRICDIATRTGEKTMVIIANSNTDKYDWIDINCRKALEKRIFNLEEESIAHPVMTAEQQFKAGSTCQVQLTPLGGEVVLRSLRCDFSDRTYEGEKLRDIKVYLTNINASCGIQTDIDKYPSRIINAGRLDLNDLERFMHPEMIYAEIDNPVGTARVYPDIRFKTYPNSCPEESVGSPYTKLVIEGRIRDNTYYYPIPINRKRDADEPGIRRNRCYIYDITITRTGLTDPDGSIEGLELDINLEVKEWKEKDWYDVRF